MVRTILRKTLVAATVGLIAAGPAQSMQNIGGATASTLKVNPAGVGHMLVVPYYSAQAGNVTQINLTNTDPVNGKAVKIRFRGASNADDIFDFQVFFSPGDSWSATVDQGPDGRAKFFTTDPTCSKPQMSSSYYQNYSFSTSRLDPVLTESAKAAGTREGYVEIINMADIQPGNALYAAIRPVNGLAPCSGTAWSNLDVDNFYSVSAANAAGLSPPSTGLMANWIIFDTYRSRSYSGAATAIQANTDQVSAAGNPVPGFGNLIYWPQTTGGFAMIDLRAYTADPLLVSGAVDAQNFDLPDLSTPYVQNGTSESQAAMLSAALAATTIGNDFNTSAAINASTDWVVSMPTRRYSAAFDYSSGSVRYTTLPTGYFTPNNTSVTDRKTCLSGVSVVETSGLLQPIYGFCGHVSLLSINNGWGYASGTLSATVALTDIELGQSSGSLTLSTPGIYGLGMPVIGGAFVRASTFGMNWPHRFGLPDTSGSTTPVCRLSATPDLVMAGEAVTLSASCSPAASAYVWTGGTCSGSSVSSTCIDRPAAASAYTVTGVNAAGAGTTANASVTVANAFSGNRSGYSIVKAGPSFVVTDLTGTTGIRTLTGAETVGFADVKVNLLIGDLSRTIAASDLRTLIELYVAFFNRIPEADGLAYWMGQLKAGMGLNQIADSFYQAAIAYSDLTDYSSTMSNADFVRIIYKNVLGRTGATAPPDADVQYWVNNLATGQDTRGTLIKTMLAVAHVFVGDATWGWVPQLLDNKITVATLFAIDQGLNYNTSAESITKGMAIAAAVSPTSISSAVKLINITDTSFHLIDSTPAL